MISVEQLIEIAKEIETSDIDWGMLSVSEDEAYRLMALNIYEMYHDCSKEVMMATILTLVVENFVLNLKLLQK